MDGIVNLPVFLLAVLTLSALPGPDFLYVLGRSVLQGRRAGVVSALGIISGAAVHVLAAIFGLSAFLAASAEAFLIVKLAGAGYLVYLGVQAFRAGASLDIEPGDSRTGMSLFFQGMLTDVLNPKAALFFMAFLPQFVDPAAPNKLQALAFLGALALAMFLAWDLGVVLAGAWIAKLLRRGQGFGRWSNRVMGTLLVGLGAALAGEEL